MNRHTLKVVEFNAVLAMLSERCETSIGANRADKIEPSIEAHQIISQLEATNEAKILLESDKAPSMGALKDVSEPVEKAMRGGALTAQEFSCLSDTLSVFRRMSNYLRSKSELAPRLSQYGNWIKGHPDLEEKISATFTPDGEVKDSASSELAKLRAKCRGLNNRIADKLHRMISNSNTRAALQDPIITQRSGRYCLPVKSDYRGKIKGIVHEASASGATLFIEPEEIVELGNELRENESAEKYEVERILSRLSSDVGAKGDAILHSLAACADLDIIFAKARLSWDIDGCNPEISDKPHVALHKARHPLISKDVVVPIDIELGRNIACLMITGPNTGGKTIAMKTVALCALLMQCGIQVPADSAKLPIFPDIFADIGDEQSLQQSLSTFSAHVKNISNILSKATSGALVLLDEIGAGTDPTEGAALAKAILAELVGKGALVIASTHYGELKAFAYNSERFQNAAVEFDPVTLKPTYRLKMGAPGASHALTVAQRLGIPEHVLESAKSQLSSSDLDVIAMIQKLEEAQKSAEESQNKAMAMIKQVKQQQALLEAELEKAEAVRKEAKSKVKEQIQNLLNAIREEAKEIFVQLRQAGKEGKTTEQLRQKLHELEVFAKDTAEELAPQSLKKPIDRPLRKGDKVRVEGYDKLGLLLDNPKGGTVTVLLGSLRATVNVSELTLQPDDEPKSTPRASVDIGLQKAMTASPELHLRMMRVEEALAELDKYLDDAVLAGFDKVRIIHGKGTGVLRLAVREHLKFHHAVKAFHEGSLYEGGSGATIVELK